MRDAPSPIPTPRWVGRLGQMASLAIILLVVALAAAPLVWAVRHAWSWALG